MGLFPSFYGLGFILPAYRILHVSSATWWAPALQADTSGEEEEGAARKPGTGKNLLQESMTTEQAGITPPRTFLKVFSKLHSLAWGC